MVRLWMISWSSTFLDFLNESIILKWNKENFFKGRNIPFKSLPVNTLCFTYFLDIEWFSLHH